MWPHCSAVGRLQGGFRERESKPGKETRFAAVCSLVPGATQQTAGKETCLLGAPGTREQTGKGDPLRRGLLSRSRSHPANRREGDLLARGSGNARANRERRPASPRFALSFPEPPSKPQGRRPACSGLRERESKPGKETRFAAVCSLVPGATQQTAGQETCLLGAPGTREQTGKGDPLRRGLLSRSRSHPANRREGDLLARGSGNERANRERRPASPRFALSFPEPPSKPQGRRSACSGLRERDSKPGKETRFAAVCSLVPGATQQTAGKETCLLGAPGTREQTGKGDPLRRGLLSRSRSHPANRREGDLLALGSGNERANRERRPA
ncbi:uncharacterized protein LOC127051950 [Gopherus flavomarginatus]|uniref:uncharacterized protein LOC127051950 n=1 Tax=Gopherus flavomarginatus TaxID=286002 RepID=UPI0021CBAF2C|nr:uncharacterized protein LOC127051950 [Gopherus flavomarginatus]